MKLRRVPKGTLIVSQEAPNDTLYFVERGRVKLVIYGEDGRAFLFARLERGQLFGETSVIDGGDCDVTAEAETDAELFCLSRADLQEHLERYPDTALMLVRILGAAMRARTEIVARLGLLPAEKRVLRALQDASEPDPRQLGIVRRPPTHQDLADMVGARRETVSRLLSSLKRRGLIKKRGRSLVLSKHLEPAGLLGA